MRQAAPDGQRGELHARRLKAQSFCSDSMPSAEMTFSDRVAAKTRVLENKAQKNKRVRLTLKSKKAWSSESGTDVDGNSSLSSGTSESEGAVGFGDMVSAMVEQT